MKSSNTIEQNPPPADIRKARAPGKVLARLAAPEGRRSLAPTVAERLAERDAVLPVWVRAPKGGGVEYFCGLTRAKLYEEATKGTIRSASIREPGHVKGCRLFHLRSILHLIARNEIVATQEQGAEIAPKATDPEGAVQ